MPVATLTHSSQQCSEILKVLREQVIRMHVRLLSLLFLVVWQPFKSRSKLVNPENQVKSNETLQKLIPLPQRSQTDTLSGLIFAHLASTQAHSPSRRARRCVVPDDPVIFPVATVVDCR